MKFLLYTVLLVIFVSNSYHMETSKNFGTFQQDKNGLKPPIGKTKNHRTKRGIWDVFQKMVITKNLIVDQYTDTRDTFNEVYNLFNGQFSDANQPKPTRRPAPTDAPRTNSDETTDSSETMKTTTEPYRISQFELGQVIGRNYRGLQRLAKLEFQDALNASHYNIQEYRAEASKQFANSLAAEKKKRIKAFMNG